MFVLVLVLSDENYAASILLVKISCQVLLETNDERRRILKSSHRNAIPHFLDICFSIVVRSERAVYRDDCEVHFHGGGEQIECGDEPGP